MKKKLLVAFWAIFTALCCAFGFTACGLFGDGSGNGSENGSGGEELETGEKVTEEQWKSAFDKVFELDNFTLTCNSGYGFKDSKISTSEYVETTEDRLVINFANDLYSDYTIGSSSGIGEHKKFFINSKDENYFVAEENCRWVARNLIGAQDDEYTPDYSTWRYDFVEGEIGSEAWSELKRQWLYYYNTGYTFGAGYVFENIFATKSDSEDYAKLKDLYSAFKYKDGVYSATVYVKNLGLLVPTELGFKYTVKVSIKDGCISGISAIHKKGSALQSIHYFLNFSVTDIGTTTVTVPDGLREAFNTWKENGGPEQDTEDSEEE